MKKTKSIEKGKMKKRRELLTPLRNCGSYGISGQKESCFDVPRDLFMDLHTLRFKGSFVTYDELVGTLVDVESLFRVCCDLVAVSCL